MPNNGGRVFGTVALGLAILIALPTAAFAGPRGSGEADSDAVLIWLTDDHRRPLSGGDTEGGAAAPVSLPHGRADSPPPPSCDAVDFTAAGENSYYVDFNGCFHPGAPTVGSEFLVTTPVEPGEEEAEPQQVPVVVTADDLARLPISPGGLNVQPDRGWVLVNLETIVWTDATPQVFDAVVLDTPVRVRVEPISYSWDFGDGSAPLTTTDAGAPYPNHSVSHVYTRASEGTAVTVTTQWSGEFEVNGSGVWQPVAGTAVTSGASTPFEVRTAETSLTNG